MKIKNYLVVILLSITAIFFTCIYFYKQEKNSFKPRFWLGLLDYRINFRDVGKSLNSCLQHEVFYPNVIYRANKYFSGWNCAKISNPDKIYSLNFDPIHPHKYYCIKDNSKYVYGAYYNFDFVINDIELLPNWKKLNFKKSMCSFIKSTLIDIASSKSILYHCDAGKDRTGTYTAMLAMMLFEQKKSSFAQTIDIAMMRDAIECDYEKTHSLEKEKIGKMKKFLYAMEKNGGVSEFINKQCDIDLKLIQQAANNFVIP